MAKKRKAVKKKTAKRKSSQKLEIKNLEVQADVDMLRGRYANHIRVAVQDEEFVLDFFARVGEQVTLLSRIYITPEHGKRLYGLLRRQLAVHKKQFGAKAKKK